MQDEIVATGVGFGAWAFFQERPPITGQEEGLLGRLDWIGSSRDRLVDYRGVVDYSCLQSQFGNKFGHIRMGVDRCIHV